MIMTAKKWLAFPGDTSGFSYEGAALKKAWPRLHAGDCTPYPDAKAIAPAMAEHAALKKILKGDAKAIAAQLEEGWRAFHAGQFQAACSHADAVGAFGAALYAKAAGIYASNICTDEAQKQALLQDAASRCEAAAALLSDDPNTHYFHAFALGRYSQSISITKALAQGLGGKIKTSLKAALELAPEHAEAHIALGMYHAEIISKIGGMIGKLTYGASADEAVKHFDAARKLAPKAPVAFLESGRGLMLLNAKKNASAASALIGAASKCKPADAMEWLDVQAAQSELE
jgi:hypothetical protein